ncbi:MAG TPA: thermonuclease family protein [Abditibacteriaceae bacterium]|jgi:endonuclease YncB( thermonuclease family)
MKKYFLAIALLVCTSSAQAKIYQRWVPQATAQCGDGTYTDSSNRSTCAGNGGVRRWLGGSSRSSLPSSSSSSSSYRPEQAEFIARQRRAIEMQELWAAYRQDQVTDAALRRPSPAEVARAGRLSNAMIQQEYAARRAATLAQTKFTGKCIGVAEGDIITVANGGLPVRVRLYGIDCPETRQAFGVNAKQFTTRLVLGKTVTIQGKGVDRSGVALGWVSVGNRNVNSELVKNGLAWWYRESAPNERGLARLQQGAILASRGLWSSPSVQAPWEFRRRQFRRQP